MRKEKEKIKLFTKQKNILKYIWLWIKSLFFKENNLHAKGTHIITAYPGGGKSLLMNVIRNDVDNDKYFFLSNIKEFDDVKTFELTDIFKGNEQIKRFPLIDDKGRKLYGIVFDEINLQFNKRLNRKSDYNDIFVGLVEFLVSHRHQGVPRIYFIGQKLELQDTQLQSLFKYWHDIIKKKERYRYWYYYKYYFCKIPVKLKINNYVKIEDNEYLEASKCKIKITEKHLTNYNTKALADLYKDLPLISTK